MIVDDRRVIVRTYRVLLKIIADFSFLDGLSESKRPQSKSARLSD